MSIKLAMDGLGTAFAPESYFRQVAREHQVGALCLSVGAKPVLTTTTLIVTAWTMQIFDTVYIMTAGGPARSHPAG